MIVTAWFRCHQARTLGSVQGETRAQHSLPQGVFQTQPAAVARTSTVGREVGVCDGQALQPIDNTAQGVSRLRLWQQQHQVHA